MSNTKDMILDLLTDGEKPVSRAPVRRREVEEIPDALVLCVVETICKGCSTHYHHPNPQILGRFGRNHKRIAKWSSLFETLPRERLKLVEKAVACQNCFEGCVLRTENMEGIGRQVT